MKKRVVKKSPVPEPVKYDSRICFGIAYFQTKADAEAYAAHVRAKGITYNGGYYDGMPCGRDTTWDYTDSEFGPLYAVTD